MDGVTKLFFIVGYPRSRTKWFSYFFTEMGKPCEHDLIGKVKTLEEYVERVKTVGDSDSGLIYLPTLDKLFPDSKIILIERDIDEVMNSLNNRYSGKYSNTKEILEKAFSTFRDNVDCLKIKYNDINSKLEEIWEYISSDEYDSVKATELTKYNIQEKV